ncbi:hypothetical protein BFZC1_16290 [Lysinibacillus fusiformis ZC1]|nr:hypothetical protein BFZC1_16290 [Lysinibacillus fusiformis ZC1]
MFIKSLLIVWIHSSSSFKMGKVSVQTEDFMRKRWQ